MEPLAMIRRALIGLLGAALGAAALVAAARGDEVAAMSDARATVVHGPQETLRDFCHLENGALWFVLPDGTRFELITSTAGLPNPGDGAFHPFDEAEVQAAVDAVRYPLGKVVAEVYLLPYPRRGALQSGAGPGLILLSPGVRPLAREQQHAEFTHELGHVVQYALLPDHEIEAWARYRALRGITDETLYQADARHADRPHEIFAEDFRALFGSALANYSGTIENPALALPATVPGLRAFMLGLAGPAPEKVPLAGFPNPSRGAMSFSLPGVASAPLDLFDLAGRRVATVEPRAGALGSFWHWDGRDATGRAVRGVLFARLRGRSGATLRVTVLP